MKIRSEKVKEYRHQPKGYRKEITCMLLIILIIPACIYSYSSPVSQDILFRNFSNKNGLSHSTVYTSVQDTTGYMWFGTQDGLNRFDGHDFVVFRQESDQPGSIGINVIRKLFVDSSGRLWLGGDRGISRYLYEKESFQNYPFLEDNDVNYVSSIVETKDHAIYASTITGQIFRLLPDSGEFREIRIQAGQKAESIFSMCARDEHILLATGSGIHLLNTRDASLQEVEIQGLNSEVRDIIEAPDGGYWLGTDHVGLWKLNGKLKAERAYVHDPFDRNSLCNDNVRSLCLDGEQQLWVGTFIGLSILDKDKAGFVNIYSDPGRPFSLAQNSIRSISRDRDGGMWLGSYYGGVSFYHPDNLLFDLLNQNGGSLSLSDNVISCIIEDQEGKIWIGTNDGGVNIWSRNEKKISVIRSDEKDKRTLSSNNIKSMVITPGRKILIGTHDAGLNYYDPVTGRNLIFKKTSGKQGLSGNNIYSLLKDHTGTIWVGTWNGIDLFSEETKTFLPYLVDGKKPLLTSDNIQYLFEDSGKRIWIGTDKGLNIITPKNSRVESFISSEGEMNKGLSNNYITCVNEDSKGRIWIGTRNGFNLFDEQERKFIPLTTRNGLPNDMVYGILEDEFGFLWISTNGGLSKYDPEKGDFRNYNETTGLQSNQFNYYSFCRLSDGTLMFGGIKGINLIDPGKAVDPDIRPRLVISGFSLLNKTITPEENPGILDNAISYTSAIRLKHFQNVFSFRFSSINYVGIDRVKYDYMLEGWDEKWIPANDFRTVSYSNIPPGNYHFRVRIPESTVVAGDERQLTIRIQHPWWTSRIAYFFYFLLFFSFMYLTYRIIREQINDKNQLRIERIEKKNLEEINQMKLQFFTNISHEFRTPLTLILSPLYRLKEHTRANDWMAKQLDLIDKNVQRLLKLVDELMEFRKSEQGMLKLKAIPGDLVTFTQNIYQSFTNVAMVNNIMYTFDSDRQNINMVFDPSCLEKVIYNLLSNSFKYTPSGGSVTIRVSREGEQAVIEVSDTGKGIKSTDLPNIFERFYRGAENSPHTGFGIGLALTKKLVEMHHGSIEVESESGKGSLFTVRLPAASAVYSADEMGDSENAGIPISPGPVDNFRKPEPPEKDVRENEDTILLVEDNEEILQYIRENLSDRYTVLTSTNGEEALAIINSAQPSLVISDVMMPVMDGMSLCAKLKKNIKTCHIPVILLTAKASVPDMIEGFQTGADDYIVKPFVFKLLQVKIDNLIRSRKRLREIFSQPAEIVPEKITMNALDEELLRKALKIVEDHMTESEYSVDDFARELGMSRSNLHLKLKAITGEPATVFIKKVRFSKAIKLIEENRYSIAEVSYMTGFSTPSYFSTNFKKYFGYHPSEHLKKKL